MVLGNRYESSLEVPGPDDLDGPCRPPRPMSTAYVYEIAAMMTKIVAALMWFSGIGKIPLILSEVDVSYFLNKLSKAAFAACGLRAAGICSSGRDVVGLLNPPST